MKFFKCDFLFSFSEWSILKCRWNIYSFVESRERDLDISRS